MSAAERERLRRVNSSEAPYRIGALLKCAVCVAMIGLLALIGSSGGDDNDAVGRVAVGVPAMVAP